ncbi:hypothetical protein ACFQZZ_14775 [Nocardia sp. GCM10030253]|uniref:hypothetical protein n=1 Tax=Nocardia sp. GCM10030253 TaxID=3273404 RepID=UPI00362E7D33
MDCRVVVFSVLTAGALLVLAAPDAAADVPGAESRSAASDSSGAPASAAVAESGGPAADLPRIALEYAAPGAVPPRTAISFRSAIPGIQWGTANEHETRTGLSMVKLYMVDYALRHGDGSPSDRTLAERMIRDSDDGAAELMGAKYPQAIDAIAAEYRLTATTAGASWGMSYTSTADVATFLETKQRSDPESPIFDWMAAADAMASDGTLQDWGTARLPGVLGTKWGWSDFGQQEVASASFGHGFAVAAHTRGTPDEQTADVTDALAQMMVDLIARRIAPG